MNVLPRIDSAVSTTSDTSYRKVIERLKRFDMLVYVDINSFKDLIYMYINLFMYIMIIIRDFQLLLKCHNNFCQTIRMDGHIYM